LSQLPEKLGKKLPKHPITAALIGRLAVNKKEHGCKIGKMLLADVIKRTLALSNHIAIYEMVVDAINDEVQAFYEQYGFTRLSDNGSRLFPDLFFYI
jgi:predicted GNAT family N-acyltransferase